MNKILLFIGMCILLTMSVSAADSCFTNSNCTWYVYNANAADGVNISFTYDNGTTSSEFAMDDLTSGKYLYSTTFLNIGNILGCARSYNSSGTIATVCESKLILNQDATDVGAGTMSLTPIAIILGIAVICALLLWIAFKLDNSHVFWKIFIIMMVVIMLTLVPKAALDANRNCAMLPVNSSVVNGVSNYEYDLVCIEGTESTSLSLYKNVLLILRIFFIYVGLYIFWVATDGMAKLPKLAEKGFNKRK